jgi:AraC-like DNA-binding protein
MLNRSELDADPLSSVLDVLDARCELSGELIAGGKWARCFDNLDAIKLCAAIQGQCWYFMEGLDRPVLFEAGDVLVMNGLHSLILASKPDLIASATSHAVKKGLNNQYQLGKGHDFAMLGGIVQIDSERRTLLQSGLPPLIHVRGDTGDAAPLIWLLNKLVTEMNASGQLGRTMMTTGLTQLLFVQTLRAYLMQAPTSDKGWLKGFGDKRLALALTALHSEPARNWTLDDLAKTASMSRTAFAVRFREMIGVPPLTYLTQWRMQLAGKELRSGASVAEAAFSVGYNSESAFSSAFKRFRKMAPGEYRRTARENA